MSALNNIVISIAGDSGVGKSSIANLLKMILGHDDVLLLKCDDLHKWERRSEKWENVTHLNPIANDLEKGYTDLSSLSQGKNIFRRFYCHQTGKFSDPIAISPNKFIIHEGLHAFYTEKMVELSDLKIFIEATDALRTHWKVVRDVHDRSHDKHTVLQSIQRRKNDYEKFVIKQKASADIILKFSEKSPILSSGSLDENPSVSLSIEIKSREAYMRYEKIISQLIDYNDRLDSLVQGCREIGDDVTLTQASGGNISVKLSRHISSIKASGHELRKISRGNGITFYDPSDIQHFLNENSLETDESLREYDESLFRKLLSTTGRASMESGFHACLSSYVVHTHPIYVNVLLCLKNAHEIILEVFGKDCGCFVNFKRPGFEISKEIMNTRKKNGVFWLKNHGIITSYDSMDECLEVTRDLNERAFLYIKSQVKNMIPFEKWESNDNLNTENFLTPDASVFSEKPALTPTQKTILLGDSYIRYYGAMLGNLDFLHESDVDYIKNMKFEKYRRAS